MDALTCIVVHIGVLLSLVYSQPPPPNFYQSALMQRPWQLGSTTSNRFMTNRVTRPNNLVSPKSPMRRYVNKFLESVAPNSISTAEKMPSYITNNLPIGKSVRGGQNIQTSDLEFDTSYRVAPADQSQRGMQPQKWKPVRLWEERSYEKVDDCCDFVLTDEKQINTSVLVPFDRLNAPPTRWPVFQFFTPSDHGTSKKFPRLQIEVIEPISSTIPLQLYRIIDYRYGLPNADPKYRSVRLALVDGTEEGLVDADNLALLFVIGSPDDQLNKEF